MWALLKLARLLARVLVLQGSSDASFRLTHRHTMAKHISLLVIAISLLNWASAAQVSYFDGGSYIKAADSNQLSTADAVTVVLGSLLNAETSAHSTAGVSEQVRDMHQHAGMLQVAPVEAYRPSGLCRAQVEEVLSASVFQRPSVVLAVQVLGAGE